MELNQLRGYDSEKIISVKLKRKIKSLPDTIGLRFQILNSRTFLTTINNGSHAEFEVLSDAAFIRELADNKHIYVATAVSYNEGVAQIKVLLYNETDSPSEFVCAVSSSLSKKLRCAREELCRKVKTMAVCAGRPHSTWVIGTLAEPDETLPPMLLICAENDGYIHVSQKTVSEKVILIATDRTMQFSAEQLSRYRIKLMTGTPQFVTEEEAEKTTYTAAVVAKKIEADANSFFRLWNEYGSFEFGKQLSNLVDIGIVEYETNIANGKFCLVFPNAQRKAEKLVETLGDKANGASLLLWQEDPSEIINKIKEMYFECENTGSCDYSPIFTEISSSFKAGFACTIDSDFSIQEFEQTHTIPLKSPPAHKSGGFLTYNPKGDTTIYQRRIIARDAIASGKSCMQNLGAILEDVYPGSTIDPRSRIKEIPAKLEREIFKEHGPTKAQREAVLTAVNTPDIAIIQGPPGTGKTTVITCIIRMLNDMSSSDNGLFGKNLITAFQHDAVENAISRIENFGLPAIKIGERASGGKEKKVINSKIKAWALKQKYELEKKYPDISNAALNDQFDASYKVYLRSSNSLSAAISVLENALNMLSSINAEFTDVGKRIKKLLAAFRQQSDASSVCAKDTVIGAVSILPLSEIQYSDNGQEIIENAIRIMKAYDGLFEKEIRFLEEFLNSAKTREDFEKLRAFTVGFLSAHKPKPAIFSSQQDNFLVQSLLNQAAELVKDYKKNHSSPEDAILEEYYTAIRSDYGYVRDTILSYSSVSGATNQHAVSQEIFDLKGDKYYENVIVDEAARSNPLDLLIPMAVSKQRIILVGDHRQLPHLLDEEIARTIEQKSTDEEERLQIKQTLEESLFGRLKKILTGIEKKDGIKRCITLDKQFRTHPLLGNFLSENFYESHDVTEHFDSPKPAEDFAHKLPGLENKAAVWMDVPASAGSEKRNRNKSRYRTAEASAIARHIKAMMDSDAGKELSFGIITFYSGQIKEIYDALIAVGIAEESADGPKLLEEYEFIVYEEENTTKTRQRLKIGSVDAFQGMEFDVVYLSTVISNSQNSYGFLKIENRLCVAMSRQKKLLIVVGDSNMFAPKNGKPAVPSLYQFRQLCESESIYGKII